MNASLIKSTDQGHTWTRSAQENYERPMWHGGSFGARFFVHYGRNGGKVEQGGARQYVYACSTNGFWNDGDSLILGRVLRTQLSPLKGTDWEYLSAPEGSAMSSWSRSIKQAVPILSRPRRCGQTLITFVRELGMYLLVSWYNTETMTRWFEPNRMRYDFYQAPHSWGTWTPAGTADDSFLGSGWHMYGPSICAAFQQRRGQDIELSLFTSGCAFDDVLTSRYKMWRIPLMLKSNLAPSSRFVSASGSEVQYTGMWFPWTTTQNARGNDLPRATQSKGPPPNFRLLVLASTISERRPSAWAMSIFSWMANTRVQHLCWLMIFRCCWASRCTRSIASPAGSFRSSFYAIPMPGSISKDSGFTLDSRLRVTRMRTEPSD